jgi:SAM dependent carboxyl methyltransferase
LEFLRALWLSQIPTRIPDHFYIPCSGGAVRVEFDQQAAADWKLFLSLRATELRPGGRLVIVLPSLEEDGSTVWREIMDDANAVLSEMVALGTITAEERQSMTMANCPRRQKDLLAPFLLTGEFERLVVERCGTSIAPDLAWMEYERDGDAASLARKRALFFRVTFVPSLLPALAPTRSAEDKIMFADRLQGGLQHRLEGHPAPVAQLVGTIVVAKQAGVESRRQPA